MKRIITLGVLIIISFLLQYSVFSFHNVTSVSPNLLLILTMSFGIMRGRKEGMLIGFFSGFLVDCFYGQLIGPYMLLFMLIGYVNGFFHRNYLMEDIFLPVVIITFDEFVFELAIYIFVFLLNRKFEFKEYLFSIILPQMMYTIIITIIIYRFFVLINKLLKNKFEKDIL
ncbi:MAG: rod shape-determining protein MreD [Eubacterium sp.]|nr:rod shape-determining protein MreD [Eubacterium sp.]MCR5293251.1 rod shape-determining protein MreD [Eubacterium sp.]